MNNSDEILSVVGIEVPKGGSCMGTKVKLSNGQYLTGIQSITLHADTDSERWSLSLKLDPKFVDQQTIEAVLANINAVKSQQALQRKEAIRKQVELLQAEYVYLGKYDEITETSTQTSSG